MIESVPYTRILPVAGRLVRNPATGLPVTKETAVPAQDPFWLKRLQDGDVVKAETAPKTESKGSKK